jgi:DNA repair protein RadD
LGLTATPFRRVDHETRRLARSFHRVLLAPRTLGSDVIAELRGRAVLSEPTHQVIDWGSPEFEVESVERYRDHYKQFQEFHPQFLEKVGQSPQRNRALLGRLLELPADWPTLFFGCSVEHAVAMAVLLRRQHRAAAAVTSATRAVTRRALIEDFREGRLSVLCNYGVLTTGFDAPKVRALVVARPTTSPVLYEQMIGRGMRGPRFGGTSECLVIDIADNIDFHGSLAYKQYRGYWSDHRVIKRRRAAWSEKLAG